ncbi:CHRD domain-containing protein [Dyadobacter sp. SG02]|uniref:CHRD domain-containing protein n=1 Tax=Dyadobacter sp. SG02 TaxID=1855291 RepID=UPI0008BDD926|nr:CHRD domain-containing protein [Dyadobacter sp. SG02]SEI37866.1 CHRD domain-containing protein [Dyadobacter sp. SG02]
MKKVLCKFGLVWLLVALFAACDDHDTPQDVLRQNGLPLSGSQETAAKKTPASGWADVSYNKTTHMLTFTLNWANLTGVPTGAHIHGTAARGTNAGIQFDFFSSVPQTPTGSYSASVLADGTKINENDLLNGLYYFNIHTMANPGGEIRGQIEFYDQPHIVVAKGLPLEGSQQVPGVPTSATGTVDVMYNKSTKLLSYFIKWKDLVSTPTGSHIHGIAPRGANAPIQHDFFANFPRDLSGEYSNSVLVDGVKIKEAELLNGLYYFNIHNVIRPGGEIRAQIEF